jgi:glycosyltransferase involved in cell wall biosynthesis
VGEGPRRVQIEEELLEMGLEEFVFLIGHRDEIPRILQSLDVFVLPSYANEGVPQALLQALAMERPVVATNIGGIPEVIDDRVHGLLCEPQNPAELAADILEILRKPEYGKKLAQVGRKRVVETYSLERMVDRLELVYSEMLDGKLKPSQGSAAAIHSEREERAAAV